MNVKDIFHADLLKHCNVLHHQNGYSFQLKTSITSVIETVYDKNIFVAPLFSNEFCNELCSMFDACQETKHAQHDKQYSQPNGLSNDGVIPTQFGYTLPPVVSAAFEALSNYLLGANKAQKPAVIAEYSYLIRYRLNADKTLKCHTDDSDITINVCLNDGFKGSELYFYPNYNKADTPPPYAEHKSDDTDTDVSTMQKIYHQHKKGYAVFHAGGIYHGVDSLQSGQRYNLIHWMMIEDKDVAKQDSWKKDFYTQYISEL